MAKTSSVAGSITSNVVPPGTGRHVPSISKPVGSSVGNGIPVRTGPAATMCVWRH